MTLRKRPLADMTRDSLRYLSSNTEITYFSRGSIARALVEATNLEISRLQDFVATVSDNSFLTTANGIFLDLFGEMLGLPRITDRRATASIEDGTVRFYVESGTLGARLPGDAPGQGLIPRGIQISSFDGSVVFETTSVTTFPINSKSAFVPVAAANSGASFNVGANQLIIHNLADTAVKVTNDIAITTGSDIESDSDYRFRLSKAMTTKYGSNKTAVQVAAASQPGVSRAEIVQYARGAGTFDVLLVPQANKLSKSIIDDTRRVIESVTAYGVNPSVREPSYVPFKVMAQLRYDSSSREGERLAARRAAESAVLRFFASISLGGEMIVNQLRAAILASSQVIKDVKIIEFCIDGKPRVLTNLKLEKDELFIPDPNAEDSVQII